MQPTGLTVPVRGRDLGPQPRQLFSSRIGRARQNAISRIETGINTGKLLWQRSPFARECDTCRFGNCRRFSNLFSQRL